MGSKTFKKVAVPLVVLAFGAVPAGAIAEPHIDYSKNGATGQYQPRVVHKDYSKNGASGDFAPAVDVPSAAHVAATVPQASDDSFAWGAAAAGAASMLLVVLVVGMTTRRVRRRVGPPSATRPSAV